MVKRIGGNPAESGISLSERVALKALVAAAEAGAPIVTPLEQLRPTFVRLAELARTQGFDLLDPAHAPGIVDVIRGHSDRPGELICLYHDFVHFRQASDPSPDWDIAHGLFDEQQDDPLALALNEASLIGPEEMLRRMRTLAIRRQIPALLEWIGSARPVTPAGLPKRADIQTVSALLGLDARGAASYSWDDTDYIEVKSLSELPIVNVWWDALIASGVIERTATRVRPGPLAATFLSNAEDLSDCVQVVFGVVFGVFTDCEDIGSADRDIFRQLLDQAMYLLDPEWPLQPIVGLDEEFAADDVATAYEELVASGLVCVADGQLAVSEQIRPVFAQAIATISRYMIDVAAAAPE